VHGGTSASAKEIADRYGIPLPLLAKSWQKLAKQGFLKSEHGTHGELTVWRAGRRTSPSSKHPPDRWPGSF